VFPCVQINMLDFCHSLFYFYDTFCRRSLRRVLEISWHDYDDL